VIRFAVVAALLLSPGFAQASRRHPAAPEPPPPPDPPDAPQPPQAPQAPRTPRLPFQLDLDIEIPDMSDFAHLPKLIARGRDEDDEDQDEDKDEHDDSEQHRDGVRIYKMRPEIRIPRPRVRGWDEWGENWWSNSTASVSGRGSATLRVKGPVTFQLRVQAGDVEVSTVPGSQVLVAFEGKSDEEVSLYAFGDRIEPSFRGRRNFNHGKLHLSPMSGDVTAQRLSEASIRTMSGDVKLTNVAKADVQTISGDVRIDDARGPIRLHTVSGHAVVNTSSATPQVEFQSASGAMDWSGVCAKDCHLSAETVSGELHFMVDPRSSFDLSYTSHSGELRDELNLSVKRSPRRRHGMSSGWLEATYGKGEGVIEADAFSGNLTVRKK